MRTLGTHVPEHRVERTSATQISLDYATNAVASLNMMMGEQS